MITRRAMLALMGGLPYIRPDQHYEAPTGAIVPGARGVLTVRKVVISGSSPPGAGFYVYSGPPSAGDLIAAIVAAAGTDGHTNAVLKGIASYDPAALAAVQLNGGAVSFYSAASEAGPWNALGQIADGVWQEPATSGLNLKVGAVPAQIQIVTALVTVTVPELITVAISSGVGLDIVNANSSSGTLMRASTAAIGNTFLSFRVTGDAFVRQIFDTDGSGNPRIRWGGGTATADTSLVRSAANLLSVLTADLDIGTTGRGLQVAEGSNAKQGTATLAAGTVTVANTSVTANSRIFLTAQNSGAAPGALRVSARTAGTSFTITSTSNTDTSLVAYEIFEPG